MGKRSEACAPTMPAAGRRCAAAAAAACSGLACEKQDACIPLPGVAMSWLKSV